MPGSPFKPGGGRERRGGSFAKFPGRFQFSQMSRRRRSVRDMIWGQRGAVPQAEALPASEVWGRVVPVPQG